MRTPPAPRAPVNICHSLVHGLSIQSHGDRLSRIRFTHDPAAGIHLFFLINRLENRLGLPNRRDPLPRRQAGGQYPPANPAH